MPMSGTKPAPSSVMIAIPHCVVIGALVCAIGCKNRVSEKAPPARGAQSSSDPVAPPASSPVPASPASGLSDPQIVAMLVAANNIDIDASKQALRKAKHADVIKYAQLMLQDHTAANKAMTETLAKLTIAPEATDASKSLTSHGADTLAHLALLDGSAFDKAYIDNEVVLHNEVLKIANNELIPSATKQEIKNALSTTKPLLETHLAHAQRIQGILNGNGGSSAEQSMRSTD